MLDNIVYVFIDSAFTIGEGEYPFTYNTIPEYYIKTLNFNKKNFNRAFFLTTKSQYSAAKALFNDVEIVTIESLHASPLYRQFIKMFDEKWSRYRQDVFLYHAFLRVIYYCIFVYEYGLKNTFHVEADNLIFSNDITPFLKVFESGEFGFSNEKILDSAPAIIFLRDRDSAQNLLNLHFKLLRKGEEEIRKILNIPYQYITDMNFLYLIYQYNKNYKMLPCLPFGDQGENVDKLNMLFDPTSYGQYLGGTNNGHERGYINPLHYAGQHLEQKTIEVVFKDKPFIIYEHGKLPLFNLHLQNKKAIPAFL